MANNILKSTLIDIRNKMTHGVLGNRLRARMRGKYLLSNAFPTLPQMKSMQQDSCSEIGEEWGDGEIMGSLMRKSGEIRNVINGKIKDALAKQPFLDPATGSTLNWQDPTTDSAKEVRDCIAGSWFYVSCTRDSNGNIVVTRSSSSKFFID